MKELNYQAMMRRLDMSPPCDIGKRSLIEHTRGTAEIGRSIANGPYGAVASSRLTFMGINTSKEDFVKNTVIACVMHDIGKASIVYQEVFDEKCIPKKHPEFFGHEIISATYTYFLLYDLIDYRQLILLTLAVINHMHASGRYIHSDAYRDGLNRLSKKDDYFRLHPGVSAIFKLLPDKDLAEKVDDRWKSQGYSANISFRRAKYVIGALDQTINNEMNKWPKLYTLYLCPLSVGDILDAEKRADTEETETRKRFREELKAILAKGGSA
jgi:CRISPR-associated endonuclease Cas3-HD